MGLIEIIGEFMNPGKRGTVNITKRKPEKRIGIIIVKTILSIAIVAGLYYLIFGFSFHVKGFLLFLAIMAGYCLLGYFISPKPDYTNVGWLGGIIDNPFKISDDFNRMLIFSNVLFMPGRLISTTVLSWVNLLRK